MELSIHEVARLTGASSRTLRHYDAIGLLAPSGTGANGYRRYDEAALVRLQRILLLRELGLGLAEIRRVLDRETDEVAALRAHLDWLAAERDRIDRQVAAVSRTIAAREEGGEIVASEMFDGFDHTQYKDEVVQRWGEETWNQSDRWWTSMSPAEQEGWKTQAEELGTAWREGAAAGLEPAGDEAQAIAARHVDWLAGIPGTPGYGAGGPPSEYLLALADMYVADERFAASYGGVEDATFVRDTIRVSVERNR